VLASSDIRCCLQAFRGHCSYRHNTARKAPIFRKTAKMVAIKCLDRLPQRRCSNIVLPSDQDECRARGSGHRTGEPDTRSRSRQGSLAQAAHHIAASNPYFACPPPCSPVRALSNALRAFHTQWPWAPCESGLKGIRGWIALREAAVDDVLPWINERQVVPSPALPLPSTASHGARPAGATYRL
jgi:hypothetical protein